MNKNLHILPTDKLSKLYKVKKKFYIEEYPVTTVNAGNQNIYITNDEEIKEGEISYIIDKQNNIRKVERVQTKNIGTPSYYCNSHSCDSSVSTVCYSIPIEDCKRIVLTTDPELIKNGVQPIDEEFLEWFVMNPNCEEVGIENMACSGYKIIIPKEEPKNLSEWIEKEGLPTAKKILAQLKDINSKQEYVCYKCKNKTSNKFEICDKCNVGWKEPKQKITIDEIEQQVILTKLRSEKVIKYLNNYKGQSIYNEIALAIEFGYQLKLEENE